MTKTRRIRWNLFFITFSFLLLAHSKAEELESFKQEMKVNQSLESSENKMETEENKTSLIDPNTENQIEKAETEKKAEELSSATPSDLEQDIESTEESQRRLSSQNIKRLKTKRDQSFQLPETKAVKKPNKPLNLRSIQPSSSVRVYYPDGSDEAQLEEVMIQEEKQLFRLLKKNRSPELTLRLGALYVERSRYISYKIQKDHDFKMQQYKAGLRKSKPFLNLKPAQVYNSKSLKLFEDFIKSYPQHSRMDEVLFFLGFNFYQLENKKKGIEYYTELERRFPKSFYIYETRFQLGEHFYQLRNWKESYKYYQLVSHNKTGKFYFYSLYKMAWSLYRMNRFSQGLNLLTRIIKEGRAFSVASENNQMLNFREDATQDLVLFYTYSSRDPSLARSFFIDLLGEQKAWPLLEKLAYNYRDTGQTRSQIILFQNLINANPTGKKAFEYKYQIVEAVYATGKVNDIIKVIKEWVRDYGPRSNWVKANQRDRSLIKQSLNLQEVTIRDYTLKNHQSFRKTRAGKPKELSLKLYKYYFSAFPRSQYSDQMYFWYAELLFDSKRYIAAIKAYEEVISLFSKSKFAKAAYQNQILAFERSFPKDQEIKRRVAKETRPVEIPQIIKSFMRVGKRYADKFPEAENSPPIIYTMASLYFRFNHFDESTVYFRIISEKYPRHSLASNVNAILLDIYNKNKDYSSLEQLALKLSQDPNLEPKLLDQVNAILEQISLKRAEELSTQGKFKESALMYESFARKYSNSQDAVSAFFNAGLNFEKVGDHLKAISMYSSVLTYKNVKPSIRKKAHQFSAILNEKLGFYKRAADSYVSFAKRYPRDSKSSDFWFNAGVIFDALNDVPSAVYSYNQYYETSKKQDRHDIHFLIGLMYEDNRNWKRAIQSYDRFLKTPSSNALRVIRASFSIAEIYEKQIKNQGLAKQWYEKTLNLYRRLDKGRSFGARAHLYLVKKDFYDPFSRVKLPKDPKGQERALAKKIKLLQSMEKALKPVIRYNEGEVILASLALIGRSHEELARSIESAPLPKGLDKQAQAQYRQGIKKVIEPYIKKSIEHYQLVIKRSIKLRVYSESLGEAYSRLAGLQLSKGRFVNFLPQSLFQKTHSVSFTDDSGTVNSSFLNSLTKSFKYSVSREDFEKLSQAIQSQKESEVLTAVSVILNKDLKNIVAINSLAFFYLNTNRLGLAQLILNSLLDGEQSNPTILNNLAIVSLKYRKPRQAVSFLKKALDSNPNYQLASLNLANIFINQKDYQNALYYYTKARSRVESSANSKKDLKLRSNYAVALTGSQKWGEAKELFAELLSRPSPAPETLFNYSCFLAERSKREPVETAKRTLNEATELVEELKVYRVEPSLKRLLRRLSQNLSFEVKRRSAK